MTARELIEELSNLQVDELRLVLSEVGSVFVHKLEQLKADELSANITIEKLAHRISELEDEDDN